MEQHPVPQQISAYEFRLVGDMTLKQFFQLAAGALIALLIYSTNLHPFIKWPLIIFFSLSGAALAFLPFQGRPLEKWIVAFFKSIYSPTLYFWKRDEKPQRFFAQAQTQKERVEVQKLEVPKTLPLEFPEQTPSINSLEQKEASFFSKLGNLFSSHPQPAQQAQTPQPKPVFHAPENIPVPFAPQPQKPKPQAQTRQEPIKTQAPSPSTPATKVAQAVAPQQAVGDHQAQFSPEAAPPTPPTQPNLVVGQVMDEEGKIIEGAILEIRDESRRPVRAFKTNKVGHFLIATPLASGKYKIITEKEGYDISPVNIEVKGEIIQPIAIRAKKIANNEEGIRNKVGIRNNGQVQN